MKASTSSGGIKNLLLQHVEKVALGVAVILVALFLWSGLGVKPIEASKSPETLKTAAIEQEDRIAKSEAPPPPPPPLRFETAVAAGLEPVALATYSHPQRFSPPIQPPIVKRPDPKLLPVENVVATAVIISVPEMGLPPTWKEEDDEKTKKAAKKKAEPRPNMDGARGPRRRARGGGAPGYGGAQPGYGGQSEQPGYGAQPARGRGGHAAPGYGAAAQPGYGQGASRGGSESDRSSSGGGGYGAVGGARGGAPGYGAGGAYGGGGVPGAKPGVVVQGVETKGVIRPAVVLTGRVPYSKQFDEFQNKFKDAISPSEGYSAERDLPVYNEFKIERQEVTAAGDAKWVALDLAQAAKEEGRWMVQPDQDMVDLTYMPDQILAWPMPPTIGRNWGRLASHPTIPFGWMLDETQQRGLMGGAYGSAVDDDTRIGSRRRDSAQGGVGGYGVGGYGAGAAGYGASGRGGYGSGGHSRGGYGTASDGGPARAGAGAAAMAGFSDAPLTAHVPSYLFRFVDTQKVEAGKQYRYRVTLALANPNFMLEPGILADPASAQKETVLTPPAESSTVTVPHDRTLFALSAKAGDRELTEYTGQVFYHIWNPKMGAEIAKEFDLKLGEIAEFVDTVENWYNPYTGLGEKLENVPFQYIDGKPQAAPMLADITGGEKLPGAKSTDEPQPAEMLFIDASGRMFTANEARDAAAKDYYKERYDAEPAPEADSGLFEQAAPARGAPAGAYGGSR